jgi:hypothetical protein
MTVKGRSENPSQVVYMLQGKDISDIFSNSFSLKVFRVTYPEPHHPL